MHNVLKLLFKRVVVVSLCIALQVGVFVVGLVWVSDYSVWFKAFLTALSWIAILKIISDDVNSSYKLAWIIPILAFPVFGISIYLLFGGNRVSRSIRKKLQLMEQMHREHLVQEGEVLDQVEQLDHQARLQMNYLTDVALCPVYNNTRAEYFSVGEPCFARMKQELIKAKHYIFLEYFIISEGKMWDEILEILTQKAAEGVDVRVIYDDFGCIMNLPMGYYKKLEARGIRCKVFSPYVPVVTPRLNNRDHRKFMIIDGLVGFTGGINLADEYINAKERFGHWKDCGIVLEGEGVWSMTVMFLSLWNYVTGWREPTRAYRPVYEPEEWDVGFVQPFADSPLDGESVGETVFLNLIAKAKKSVYIMTPYLILDGKMTNALRVAAKTGIDVRLVTPGIPDKKYVYALTKANYEPLRKAGVRIYEYSPGFVHSKSCCVDGEFALVGTVNLDFRSLYLHFEDGVLLYRSPAVQQVEDDFTKTFPICHEVSLQECRETKLRTRIFRSLLRVFSPLM